VNGGMQENKAGRETGNQTWAACTDSSRMGLRTASSELPITPLPTRTKRPSLYQCLNPSPLPSPHMKHEGGSEVGGWGVGFRAHAS
jgi:hypothetical protein